MRLRTIIFSLIFATNVYAETCPTAIDVQKNRVPGWHAYDSDTDIKLSAARMKIFQRGAQQFALAEWMNDGKNKGKIHCYYRDKDGSNLEAYLSKDHSMPANIKTAWYQVTGSLQCARSQKECAFNFLPTQQLARN